MSRISVSFVILLVTCIGSAAQSPAQFCEATQSTRAILEILNVPKDPRKPAAERKAQELAEIRKGLEADSDDIFLHEAYQDLQIGRIGDQREAVAEEYKKLLAKHPNSPAYLYLAARAEYGLKTERAIQDLEQALKFAPTFGLPHLILAQIYFAPAFSDPMKVARHLDRFSELCPSSVRVFPELKWSKDRELVNRTAARIRKGLNGRTDAEAEAAYPILWSLETAPERSDNPVGNLTQISDDAALLGGKPFARNTAWLSALEAAADSLDRPVLARDALSEVAVLFPNSSAALWLALAAEKSENPYPTNDPTAAQIQVYWSRQREMELPLARKWPGVLSVASSALSATANDKSATSQQISEAVDLFERALNQDPEGSLSFPPAAIDAAEQLTERRVRLEDVPALVQAGLALSDRVYANDIKLDLYVGQAELAKVRRDSWYLDGYLPLAESFIRLGQLTSAADTILQIEDKLDNTRPRASTSSAERFQYAEFEARFAYVKGLYDEAEGRKLDALINYRNSIATFPVRRPRPDRRDEVMEDAQRVWKQLGGTADGWNDWATQSPLRNFYAGSREGDAWLQLARVMPGFVFTDSLGDKWKPEELSKKVTFVSLWASWCEPCRAELPYVEKLYQHFKGRDDVVVLALNVDDDPKAMDLALKELKLAVPSVPAQDFAYQLVPALALPANWIITRTKTKKFETDSTLQGWLEKAIKACDETAHASLSPD
jgi:thiol-disulfide isomerase/thioredoxin